MKRHQFKKSRKIDFVQAENRLICFQLLPRNNQACDQSDITMEDSTLAVVYASVLHGRSMLMLQM